MSGTEILGYTAGAITSLTFLPQAIKTLREKSAKDISLTMFIIAVINEALWIAYGILQHDWVIILTNSFIIFLSFIMIFLKLKYSSKKEK